MSVASTGQEEDDEVVVEHLDSNHTNIVLAGGCAIDRDDPPEGLLHGGEHFDDVSRAVRVSRRHTEDEVLPREVMCTIVENRGLRHPTPIRWQGTAPASAST